MATTRARSAAPGRRARAVGIARNETVDPVAHRPLKVCELVALEVVRDIVAERLKPGDPLIDESKMAVRYGTSRASLREALRLLEVQGLITIRAGRGPGTVVGQASPANLARTMTLYLHLMGAKYDKLLDAWVRTEPLLAELAAENPDRELVRRRLIPFLETPEDSGPQKTPVAVGLSFHLVVAELADNPVLSLGLSAIAHIHTPPLLNVTKMEEMREALVHQHADLAEAIIAGDAPRSRRLMEAHIRHIVDDFRAYWPQIVGERIEWR